MTLMLELLESELGARRRMFEMPELWVFKVRVRLEIQIQ